jgi:UDP-GlcNAc3NAcA epimerase
VNRVLTDHCSTWLFCPTATAVRNLAREGFALHRPAPATADAPRVVHCGDVMFDNSLHFAQLALQRSTILADRGLRPDGFILATLHRDHNTDDHNRLNAIIRSLLQLHRQHGLPVAFPVHPRTTKAMEAALDQALLREVAATPGFLRLPPLGFLDMIALERHARLVVTDSGGVQKEAYFFRKPCVVLRAQTEWTELLEQGQAVLADADPAKIAAAADRLLGQDLPECPPLFGDGHAAEAICRELLVR